jgi:hypothetical protein
MTSGEIGLPSREDLEKLRQTAIAAIQHAQTVMRDELADL